MYNNILVAIDVFDQSTTVFEQALQLAKMTGAKLILLHVLSRDEVGYPMVPPLGIDDNYYDRWRGFVKQGLQRLQGFAEQAQTEKIATEIHQEIGRPGHVICAIARKQKIDLIMIGNRGHSGLSEVVLGSQSNYVMHHAPCSVLVHHLAEIRAATPSKDQAVLSESV
ncbi:MAG: universal stress protein [Thermosynechococcaceae cyanobacterium]